MPLSYQTIVDISLELDPKNYSMRTPAGFKKELELFNLHRVKHCRHLVVVEGYFSAIRLHGARIPAVALMGASISDCGGSGCTCGLRGSGSFVSSWEW